MKTLTFNRVHKNGWHSYKLPGVAGAVFIDGRMLTDEGKANPLPTLELDVPGMVEPGAGISEAQAAKLAKKQEIETKKAERATAAAQKATARLEKLQEQAKKAQERAEAARSKTGAGVASTAAETVEDVASL